MWMKKNTFFEKGIFIIISVFLLILSSCWTENIENGKIQNNNIDNNKINNLSKLRDNPELNENSLERKKETKLLKLEQDILQKSYWILKQDKWDIITIHNEYQNNLNKVWKILKIDKVQAVKIVEKYSLYLKKYNKLLNEKNKQKWINNIRLEKKIESYEKFLINNFKKNWINNVDENTLKKIVNEVNVETINTIKDKLKDYTLSDWTITTKKFKESFEDFKKQNNQGTLWRSTTIEDFTKILVTEQLKDEWKCELILSEIERAYCESFR